MTSAFARIQSDRSRGHVQCSLFDGVGRSAVVILDQKRQCQIGVGQRVSRIESHGLLEQLASTTVVFHADVTQMLDAPQQTVIGRQAAGPPVRGHPDFGVLQPARHGGDDGLRHLVLNFEKPLDAAVEPLAPQVIAWNGIDQLRRDANPAAHLADASLDDVAHAELARDPAHVHGLVAILKRRVPGDDEQRAGARQFGDDVLGDAVGEILRTGAGRRRLPRRVERVRRACIRRHDRGPRHQGRRTTISAGSDVKFIAVSLTNAGPSDATDILVMLDVSGLLKEKVSVSSEGCEPSTRTATSSAASRATKIPVGVDIDWLFPLSKVPGETGPAGSITASIFHGGDDHDPANNSFTRRGVRRRAGCRPRGLGPGRVPVERGPPSSSRGADRSRRRVAGLRRGDRTYGGATAQGIKIVLRFRRTSTLTEPEPDCVFSADLTSASCEYNGPGRDLRDRRDDSGHVRLADQGRPRTPRPVTRRRRRHRGRRRRRAPRSRCPPRPHDERRPVRAAGALQGRRPVRQHRRLLDLRRRHQRRGGGLPVTGAGGGVIAGAGAAILALGTFLLVSPGGAGSSPRPEPAPQCRTPTSFYDSGRPPHRGGGPGVPRA